MSAAASSTTTTTAKETGLKLTAKKLTEFSDWYSQVIVMSEMIDYYEVRFLLL